MSLERYRNVDVGSYRILEIVGPCRIFRGSEIQHYQDSSGFPGGYEGFRYNIKKKQPNILIPMKLL